MPGTPLSLLEREEIALALTEDRSTSWAEIAERLRRHPTTIMREVEANGGRARYRPAIAERRATRQPGGSDVPAALDDEVDSDAGRGAWPPRVHRQPRDGRGAVARDGLQLAGEREGERRPPAHGS